MSSQRTLNHYISNTEQLDNSSSQDPVVDIGNHQSSSSCTECQKISHFEEENFTEQQPQHQDTLQADRYQNNTSSMSSSSSCNSSSSSSHDNGELITPLHRHIVTHSRQIEQTVWELQQQIEHLKKENQSKDEVILRLTKEVKAVSTKKLYEDIAESNQEIEKLRKQLRLQRQINKESQAGKNKMSCCLAETENQEFNNSLKEIENRRRNIEIKFSERHKQQRESCLQGSLPQCANKITYKKTTRYKNPSNRCCASDSEESQGEQVPHNQRISTERESLQKELRAHHQSQNQNKAYKSAVKKKENNAEDSLSSLRQSNAKLKEKLYHLKEEMRWMSNFMNEFLKMGEQLSHIFRDTVWRDHWPQKKRVKNCWRYVKHILDHFLSAADTSISR